MEMDNKQDKILPALNDEPKTNSLYEEVQRLWYQREPMPKHWTDC